MLGSVGGFLSSDNPAVGLLNRGLERTAMSRWQSRVEDLLYESESVEEVVDIDDTRVVVTSHRVMTFTPEMDGDNFQQVERPNVAAVETGAVGKTGLAERAIRYGVYGVLLVLAGLVLDFERFVGGVDLDAEVAQQTGAGGIVGIAQRTLNFMARLDELMQVVGALVVLAAVALAAVYWLLRTPTLAIRVAGDGGDIHVPRPDEPERVATTLQQAIIPDELADEESGKLSSVRPEDKFRGER